MTRCSAGYRKTMPRYVFRCPQGCPDFTEHHPLTAAPDGTACRCCSARARRIIGSPALAAGNGAAMRLHDRTRATADTPAVVSSPPPASRRRTPVTTNPLHRKLPRP